MIHLVIALASPIVAASRIFGLADLPPHPPLLYFSSTMVSRVCFDRGRSYKWDGCCRATSCSKNTFSALTAFSACTLTAMPLASTNLTLFYLTSKVLHTPGSTQTNFYPSQFLHKHSFTPSTFCRITLTFAPTSFYIRHVLHQPTFTNPFHTNQILHKPAFTQTNFFTNHLLRKPPFTPTSFTQPLLWACRPKARGPVECRGC